MVGGGYQGVVQTAAGFVCGDRPVERAKPLAGVECERPKAAAVQIARCWPALSMHYFSEKDKGKFGFLNNTSAIGRLFPSALSDSQQR